jgi:MraZ protein
MLTRKTQYAWMSLGGLICLFCLVLACKLRDGNRANAQPEELPPPTPVKKEASPSIFTLPPTLPMKAPELLPPPKKTDKTKEPAWKEKSSEPKATLEMPMPSEPPSLTNGMGTEPTPYPLPAPAPLGAPERSPVLPASFGPNTPTTAEPKTTKDTAPPPQATPPASTYLPYPTSKTSEKKSEPTIPSLPAPTWGSAVPTIVPVSDHENVKTQPGEPPLAPAPGPVQLYHVHGTETLHDIARRTLGSSERWVDLLKLNPTLKPDESLRSGTTVRLPADACVQSDDANPVKPLPLLRSKPPAPKAKVLPLTGTYQCSLDEKGQLTLPRAIRDQLGSSDTVLVSPGPDKCLWLTNPPHLERLGERLDHSQANEADVRVFKRLYFAQTEKLTINGDGRVTIPERLGQFAALHQEVVLVGIDDHFEVWDAARWRSYTQQKSAGHSATMAEQE